MIDVAGLASRFREWTDKVLAGPLPDGIAAFHFNIYESATAHDIELVGCPTYDASNSDWACDDIFMSARPRFSIPHEISGGSWQRGLDIASAQVRTYLNGGSPGSARLRASAAVSIGFVDGDLHLIWKSSSA